MRKIQHKIKIVLVSILFISSVSAMVISGSSLNSNEKSQIEYDQPTSVITDAYPYKGFIKIYIVEPESRWIMNDGEPYHYAFLDYALEDSLTLDYLEEYSIDTVWNPSDAGYSDVTEDNVMVVAAIFNQNNFKEYAYPPFKNIFFAHYVDAAAGARPGETDENVVSESFTHTVFIEEATATWCPYCPAMANALYSVYNSGEYPFYFIAHVADKNPLSVDRLIEFNLLGYPSSFFDGGDKVLVGGYEEDDIYISKIEQVGRRDVHELDLSIDVIWNNEGSIEISVDIANNEEIATNSGPSAPVIQGNETGRTGSAIEYTFSAEDPDSNSVYFMIEWGDGETTDWLGPVPSDVDFIQNHTWAERGTYAIRAKAKDIYDQESDWATLEVSMPKNRGVHPLLKLFEQYLFLQELFPDLYQRIIA